MIQRIKNNAFVRNSLILFAGSMVGNFIGYIFHFVIGRIVSAPVYGEVESLVSLVAIISVPSGALTMVATKYSAEAKAENNKAGSHEILSYFNRKTFFYCLPVFFLAVGISPLIKNFLKIESSWPLIIVWAMMFLSFFSAITGGILNGWQKFKEASWAGILGALVKLVTAVIFVKIGFETGGVIGGFMLGALATYIFTIYFLRFVWREKNKARDYINKIDFSPVKKYIIPVFVGNLAIVILSNADMVLAKHILSPILAGQYGALTIVSKIIFFATGIIATVLFSMSAEEHHKKNDSVKTFKQAFFLVSLIGFGAVLLYALFPQFILSMLFGARYQEAACYLVWFAISVTLFSFVNLIFQYLVSIHETKIAYYLLAISILAVLAIDLFGKNISVIIGITAAFQLLGALVGAWLFLRSYKIGLV